MSQLTKVLRDEYERLDRDRVVYSEELMHLPKGYISKKNIRGRVVYYLQYRDGKKIVSKHISRNNVPDVETQIARRKELEVSLRQIAEDQNRLRKILKL